MNKDQLISRLTLELYDLKQKLNDIRYDADIIYRATEDNLELTKIRWKIIKILDNIDSGEIYED